MFCDQEWWLLKMSEVYYQQQPTAIWNTARGVWETNQQSLLCEHLELFSESWMTSGMMRNGVAYELPMQEPHTNDSEFSFLRTPTIMETKSSHNPKVIDKLVAQGKQVSIAYQFLRTPAASEAERGHQPEEMRKKRA